MAIISSFLNTDIYPIAFGVVCAVVTAAVMVLAVYWPFRRKPRKLHGYKGRLPR